MSPVSSARPRNSPAGSSPRVGWCQRASASTATTAPVAQIDLGEVVHRDPRWRPRPPSRSSSSSSSRARWPRRWRPATTTRCREREWSVWRIASSKISGAVPAAPLRLVHRMVGAAEQIARAATAPGVPIAAPMLTVACNDMPSILDQACDLAPQLLDEVLDLGAAVHVEVRHRELVATEPGDEVRRSHASWRSRCPRVRSSSSPIAWPRPSFVRLNRSTSMKSTASDRPVAVWVLELGGEPLHEDEPVGEPGQRIGGRGEGDPVLQAAAGRSRRPCTPSSR